MFSPCFDAVYLVYTVISRRRNNGDKFLKWLLSCFINLRNRNYKVFKKTTISVWSAFTDVRIDDLLVFGTKYFNALKELRVLTIGYWSDFRVSGIFVCIYLSLCLVVYSKNVEERRNSNWLLISYSLPSHDWWLQYSSICR